MSITTTVPEVSEVIKSALSRVGEILTLPEITAKIIRVIDDPRSTARELHGIIKTDPALATKILKVVNSAFYGLPGQVSDLNRAIVLLGLNAVKNIAISASIGRMFASGMSLGQFSARDLWKHSIGVGAVTREICNIIGKKAFAEEAFLAGLIHDLGLMIERQAFSEQLVEVIQVASQAQEPARPLWEIECEIIGADHQTLGSALTAKWKFPRNLQVIAGYHHNISNLKEDARLLPTMVYIADTLCCHEKIGFHLTAGNQVVTDVLLESVGMQESDFQGLREQLPHLIETVESLFTD